MSTEHSTDTTEYSTLLLLQLPVGLQGLVAVHEDTPAFAAATAVAGDDALERRPSAASVDRAKASTASSNVPGCSQTAGMPRRRASRKTRSVTGGGVMMDTAVSRGCGRAARSGTVGYSRPATVMLGEDGLMGVAGRLRAVYQAKTAASGREDEEELEKTYSCSQTWPCCCWRR